MAQLSESPSKIPIWLDCDPGHDDACAILLSAYHPAFHLLGISTLHGNAPLSSTTYNALSVLEAIAQPQIPVIPGCIKPFCREGKAADKIHGQGGLDGTDLLPTPRRGALSHLNAIREMYNALIATPRGTAWVVATGPFTNVALLFATYPSIVDHIAGLSLMGGAIGSNFTPVYLGPPHIDADGQTHARSGNITPFAEFNVWADPEAARSVLSHPTLRAKTILIPIDLTHQAIATKKVRDMLINGAQGQTRMRTMFNDLLMFYADRYSEVFGLNEGPPLHDVLAVAVLLSGHPNPDTAVTFNDNTEERWEIDVICHGEQMGRTVITPAKEGNGVRIPRSLDLERFWDSLELCMAKADEAVGYKK